MDYDLEKIWGAVTGGLKVNVSSGAYAAFLKNTALVEIREMGDRLICTIGCPTAMVRDEIQKRFWGQIIEELERVTEKKCEVVLKIEGRRVEEQESVSKGLPLFEEDGSREVDLRRAKLREDYTFESYAVGGSNQMAHAAALAVARKPGQAYNPLFIYGGVGVGKTHLMQAIGHEAIKKGETRVLFCTSEQFTNDLVEGIKNKTTEKVRAKYRQVRVLMIDDVQFIAGKPSAQAEVFHTFNAIQADGGQVGMTSDRPPLEISKLEERLKSRFGAGLIVDIGKPDFELRTAILLIKAGQRKVDLPMDAAQLVAEQVEGVRELQGFLTRILTDAEINKIPITLERVREMLKLPAGNGTTKVVTPGEIIEMVAKYYEVGVQQLKGERRTKTVAWPRQVLMYFLAHEVKLPLTEVGRLLGGRDHSTVIHARDKIIAQADRDLKTKGELDGIRRRIFGGQVGGIL